MFLIKKEGKLTPLKHQLVLVPGFHIYNSVFPILCKTDAFSLLPAEEVVVQYRQAVGSRPHNQTRERSGFDLLSHFKALSSYCSRPLPVTDQDTWKVWCFYVSWKKWADEFWLLFLIFSLCIFLGMGLATGHRYHQCPGKWSLSSKGEV